MLPGECGRDLRTAHAAPKPLPAVREGLVSICGCQSLKGASSLPFAGPQTKPENKTPLSWAGGAALSTDHTHLEFPCWDVVQTRRRPCRLPRWQCPWWWRGWAHALVPLQGLAGVTPREGRTLLGRECKRKRCLSVLPRLAGHRDMSGMCAQASWEGHSSLWRGWHWGESFSSRTPSGAHTQGSWVSHCHLVSWARSISST